MNDISTAVNVLGRKRIGIDQTFRKRERGRAMIRSLAVEDCSTDWAATLAMFALHDEYEFGNGRFEKLAEKTGTLGKENPGFIRQWKQELADMGVDVNRLERNAIELAKTLCYERRDKHHTEKAANLMMGTYIVILHYTHELFKYGKDRLNKVIRRINDDTYIIKHREINILEFMECLYRESKVENEILQAYKTERGIKEIPIYGEYGRKKYQWT